VPSVPLFFLGAFAKLQKATIKLPHVCPSVYKLVRLLVRPSAWIKSAPTGRTFMKSYICVFFEKSGDKIKVELKTVRNIWYFT
jgi:hypothetical protein